MELMVQSLPPAVTTSIYMLNRDNIYCNTCNMFLHSNKSILVGQNTLILWCLTRSSRLYIIYTFSKKNIFIYSRYIVTSFYSHSKLLIIRARLTCTTMNNMCHADLVDANTAWLVGPHWLLVAPPLEIILFSLDTLTNGVSASNFSPVALTSNTVSFQEGGFISAQNAIVRFELLQLTRRSVKSWITFVRRAQTRVLLGKLFARWSTSSVHLPIISVAPGIYFFVSIRLKVIFFNTQGQSCRLWVSLLPIRH